MGRIQGDTFFELCASMYYEPHGLLRTTWLEKKHSIICVIYISRVSINGMLLLVFMSRCAGTAQPANGQKLAAHTSRVQGCSLPVVRRLQ